MVIRQVKGGDTDLAQAAAQVAWVKWADRDYTAKSLAEFVRSDDRVYLIAEIDGQIAGVLHAYLLPHPDGRRIMYIDEVDTKPEFRRQGVATVMMKETLKIAKGMGSDEVWLGTEDDNEPAKALYQKLKPSQVEYGPTYTWKVNRHSGPGASTYRSNASAQDPESVNQETLNQVQGDKDNEVE